MNWIFQKNRQFIAILGCLVWGLAAGIADAKTPFRLMDHLEYWEDSAGTVRLEEIVSDNRNWLSNHGAAPAFGFTRSAFWLRFQLPAEILGEETLVLLFRYALTDDIQLFMPRPEGGFALLKTGRSYPISVRTIRTQDLALEIPLANQLPDRTFYLRMQTQGSAVFPMEILSFHSYFQQAFTTSLIYHVFMGSMFIMILYNAIFYLVTRVFSYLVYVTFISSSTLFVMSVYGLSFIYIWPDSPAFNKISVPLFLALSNASLSFFNIISLRLLLRRRLARNALYANTLVASLITLAVAFVPYATIVRIATVQTAFTSLLLPIIYVALCREKYRPAYFFLLSIGTLACGAFIYSLKTFGILPHNLLTESIPMLASASQITLLTFALADQYREIQRQNEVMQRKMISMQRENIRLLDQKVEEKTRDVRVILSSIQQGIFTISGSPPRMDEEYSRHLESLFPQQEIAGGDPVHFLGAMSQLSADEMEQIRSAILCCLDSHLFNFEINEAIFPKSLILKGDFQDRRTLQVEWSPVLRKDESVGKILVALRDVTRLLELEEQKTRIDADFRLMNLVLAQTPVRVQNFLRFNRQILQRIELHRDEAHTSNIPGLLHTLKGNARTFGLPQLANICHQLEDLLKVESRSQADWLDGLQKVEKALADLERVAEKVQASGAQSHQQLSDGVTESLEHLRAAFGAAPGAGPALMKRAAEALAGLIYRDLEETVRSLGPSLDSLAHELRIPVPELIYTQETAVYVEQSLADVLQSSLVHIFTNAMIHGIDSEQQGRIQVQVTNSAQGLSLKIWDNGRGLNLDGIKRKAQRSGVLGADETDPKRIGDSIFLAGVSTAAEVSLHAGRGVGMTAVRSMLKEIGATIELTFLGGGSAGFHPFAFAIGLPRAVDPLLTRVAQENLVHLDHIAS